MKKRILSAILSAAMGLALFTGYGSQIAYAEEKGEADHIIMTYLTLGQTPADLQKVQDAVNDISVEKINVEVELKPVAISETFSNYSLWIGSGEHIDLMCVAFQGLNDYVNSGQILPLDELLEENAAEITSLAADYPIYDGATLNGEVYGVAPVMPYYGFRGGLVMREDYMQETGIELKDQYTMDEITELLVKIKENHPDIYPACVLGNSVGSSTTNFGFFYEMDNLGATAASGTLLDAESTTIENVFASEQYKEFILLMREWYESGLIMPDAATTDSSNTELMKAERTCSIPMNLQPVQTNGTEVTDGWYSVALNTTEGYYPAATSTTGTYWTVPITSKNPSAAAKFLNLIYEDQAVADLLKCGIEGEHYVKTDTEYLIAFPDGVTGDNSGYIMPLGIYGNRRYELSYSEGVSIEVNDAWTENNMKKVYPSVGYNYDTSAMSNQIIAVNSVLDQYLPSLETGSVENVEEVYEQFLSALETAGINDIIADNQKQFDAWLAEQ